MTFPSVDYGIDALEHLDIGTAVPHIRRRSVLPLTGLCEAAYMSQGYNLTIFLCHEAFFHIYLS